MPNGVVRDGDARALVRPLCRRLPSDVGRAQRLAKRRTFIGEVWAQENDVIGEVELEGLANPDGYEVARTYLGVQMGLAA